MLSVIAPVKILTIVAGRATISSWRPAAQWTSVRPAFALRAKL
jgi:hypothetical protein